MRLLNSPCWGAFLNCKHATKTLGDSSGQHQWLVIDTLHKQPIDITVLLEVAQGRAPQHVLRLGSLGLHVHLISCRTLQNCYMSPQSSLHAVPAGFTFNFARTSGAWGAGNYFSCKPSLARSVVYRVPHSNCSDPNCSLCLTDIGHSGLQPVQPAHHSC